MNPKCESDATDVRSARDRSAILESRHTELLCVLLLCAAIWAIGLPWHLLNHRVPIWDEASFVDDAQQIIGSFNKGWISGLQALYFVRGWRPIIFPAVATPFLALAQGDIILGPGLTQLFSLSLIAAYAFLLLRQFLTPPRALVGAMFVVTAPWLFNFSYSFLSEVFWMGATLGWAFHLLAGLSRKSRTHLLIAGLWLGLAGATRPAETVLIALLPLAFAMVRAAVRREVSFVDMVIFLAQIILVSIAVWQRVQVFYTSALVWGLLALCLVLVAIRGRRFFVEVPVFGLAIIAEFIFVAWYLPSLRELYLWAYDASFGPEAKMPYWRFADLSPATLWNWFVAAYDPKTLGYVVVLGAVAFFLRRQWRKPDHAIRGALRIVALSVAMLAPVFIMLLISGTDDPRRTMPEILTFYVGAVGLALVPTGALPRVRLAVVALIVLVQTLAAGANGLNLRWAALPPIVNWIGAYHAPFVGKDDNVAFIGDLGQLGFTKGRFSAYTICYRDPLVGCSRRGIPWFEVEGATDVAVEEHLPMYINMARDLDFSKPDTLAAQLKQRGYDFVVVDMFYQPDQVVPSDPLFEHASQFIAFVKNGLPPGFRQVGKFKFGDRDIYVLAVE